MEENVWGNPEPDENRIKSPRELAIDKKRDQAKEIEIKINKLLDSIEEEGCHVLVRIENRRSIIGVAINLDSFKYEIE